MKARADMGAKKRKANTEGEIEQGVKANLTFIVLFQNICYLHIYRRSGNRSESAEDVLLGIAQYGDMDAVSLPSVEDCDDLATPSTDSPGAASGGSDMELVASGGVSTIHAPPTARRQQKRKKSDDALQQSLDEVSSRLDSYKGRDEDECFAFSLVSYMRAVKPERKLKMRAHMMEVLDSYLE